MREILFRGKRLDNDKWIEGYLFVLGEGSDYQQTYILGNLDYRESVYDIWKCAEEVDPETVGQYTGMLDKNGNKIFEGDFVKLTNYVKDTFDIDDDPIIYKGGAFIVGGSNGMCSSLFTLSDIHYILRGQVIGNVHDNPELRREKLGSKG